MAALTSIRSKGKLIAICVGGALLAFVLGDFINSGSTLFGASMAKMGEINGNSIDYNDFQARVSEREYFLNNFYGGNVPSSLQDSRYDYIWEQIVRENTVLKYADDQGVVVTDQEVLGLVNTGYVTNDIRQAFINPQTGYYDPTFVHEFIKSNSAMTNHIWYNLEKDLKAARQYNKYVNMVSAGLYVTTAEVERENAQRTQISDIQYVAIPFSDIKDEEVKVSDSDIKSFYETNKNKRERLQETRDIYYACFDVIPTSSDSADIYKTAMEFREGLANVAEGNVADYFSSQSRNVSVGFHYGKNDISNAVVDSVMFAEQPGFVYGPYQEGDYYTVARLADKVSRPDSVKVSIIAISCPNGDTLSARVKVDSLLDVHKSGIDFGALAMQFSEIKSAAQDSGNIGWVVEGMSLPANLKEACFNTAVGKTDVVNIENQVYYILKVNDRTAPKAKVGIDFAMFEIVPDRSTYQAAEAAAMKFASENRSLSEFNNAVVANNIIPREAELSANMNNVNGLANSRELVRWAFDPEKSKEVSGVMTFGDRYVVAVLKSVNKKGIPTLEEMKDELKVMALNSAKGDAILAKLNGVSGVEASAAAFGKTPQQASNVSFSMYSLPGMQGESEALAVATTLGEGQVSAPVKGKNAVYVFKNVSYTPAQPVQAGNVEINRNNLMQQLSARCYNNPYSMTTNQLVKAIEKLADIDDRRVKFL